MKNSKLAGRSIAQRWTAALVMRGTSEKPDMTDPDELAVMQNRWNTKPGGAAVSHFVFSSLVSVA